jgi:4-hydroxybenzoate polyprenyltransferase
VTTGPSAAITAPGYLRRMRTYFREMFPLPAHLVFAALLYFAVAVQAAAANGLRANLASPHTAAGITTVFLVFLMMRLMDELKDLDIDRRLFPARPVPSGRVLPSDIRRTLAAAMATYLALAATLGNAAWSAFLVLVYLLLMFRFFFVPELLRRSLVLSLATHAPIVPLVLLHAAVIFCGGVGLAWSAIRWGAMLPAVAMLWAAVESWEVARKIRAASEETDYVTYSKMLGPRGAALAALALQLGASAVALALGAAYRLGAVHTILVIAALAVALVGEGRFILWPAPRHSRLRPFAEWFIAIFLAAQIVGFGLAA